MRLRKLSEGTWTVLAVEERTGCELYEDLVSLHGNKKTKATAVGFYAVWKQIPSNGPRQLGTSLYHQLDSANEIYEFRKGSYRILCFEVGGRVVLCSHLLRKTKNEVPKREIAKAIELRNAYLQAQRSGTIEIV